MSVFCSIATQGLFFRLSLAQDFELLLFAQRSALACIIAEMTTEGRHWYVLSVPILFSKLAIFAALSRRVRMVSREHLAGLTPPIARYSIRFPRYFSSLGRILHVLALPF